MYKKPITQKAKSPLKQVAQQEAAGKIAMQSKKTIPGVNETSTIDVSVVPEKATGGTQTTDIDAYIKDVKKRFPNSTGQQLVDAGYISSAYADRFPSSFSKTTTVKTPDKEVKTETPIYTRDKTDAINPYGDYQNRLIERRAGNALARGGRKALNSLAKEYAQSTADDGKKGLAKFLSNQKQARDFRRGNVEAGQSEEANFYRKVKNRTTDAQLNLDSKFEALDRARTQTKQGASRDDQVISDPRVANQTDLMRADVTAQKNEFDGEVSVAKMRYDQNVGIKHRSPMKKGYFKNK
jgi:hypothetical protein